MRSIGLDELCPCGSGRHYRDCHAERRIAERKRLAERAIPLVVIPEPDPGTRAVFEKTDGANDSVMFQGDANADMYTCGSCAEPLVLGVDLARLQGLVIKCGGCGAFNETLTSRLENPH